MKRKQTFIVLALLLIVPVLGAIFLRSGKNVYKALPYFGPKEVGGERRIKGKVFIDTIYHQVRPWSFIDQGGRVSDTSVTSGKIYVANFFFTTCPNICKDMTKGLKDLTYRYREFDDLVVLSHTVNPDFDKPEVLRKYAADNQIDTARWKLLTGTEEALYSTASKDYLLPIQKVAGGKDFIHSENLILVDRKKHIRGIYDGTKSHEIKRLIEDISVLNKQETSKIQGEILP